MGRRRIRSAVFSAIVLFGALATPGRASAQGSGNQAAAEALFDEGKRLMAAGNFAAACPKFAESQKLDPGPGTLLNLGACYEKAGKTATAWVTYKETITEAEKANRKEWATQATKRAKALEPMLSKLVVSVPDNAKVAGLTIKRDGVVVGAAEYGLAIPQDPGKHVIEASAPDKKTYSTTIELGAKGDTQTAVIPMLEDAKSGTTSAPPPAPAPPIATTTTPATNTTTESSAGGGSMKIVGLALAGVGVVGIGAGAFFGLRASGLNGDSKSNCNADQTKCNSEGLKQVDDAKSAATISTIGFIAGAALLAGGAVLFFAAKSSDVKVGRRPNVVPMATSNGGGLFLSGSF